MRHRAAASWLFALAAACAAAPEEPARDAGGAGSGSQSGDSGVGVIGREDACAMQVARAQRGPSKPLDIVFVIDNSASMGEEIFAVRSNINRNFAQLIGESGADYRVIMVSRYGPTGTDVCIEPPLAGAGCDAGLFESNGPRFFQYSVEIDSVSSLCTILETFDTSDSERRAPDGWGAYLRPEAQKAFVIITDDSASCTYEGDDVTVEIGGPNADPFEDALMFHSALLAKSPEQFGVPPEVRYQLYSIIGMSPKQRVSDPYFPHEELVSTTCDSAPGAGVVYQALSVITDSLRYPVCEGRGFDAVFRVLAQNVVESIKAECTFEIPEPPPEQLIDYRTISLRMTGGDGEALQFEQVASADDCDASSFYIEDDKLELCAQSCAVVQSDPDAEVEVLYGCIYMVL